MFLIANNIICRYIIYVTSIHNVRSTYTHAYIICSHTANRDVTRHPITLLLSSVCRRRTYAAWHSVQFRTPTEARVKFIFYVINYSNFFTTKISYEINFFRDLQVIANILNILVFFFCFFFKSCHTKECGKCIKFNITPDITVLHSSKVSSNYRLTILLNCITCLFDIS